MRIYLSGAWSARTQVRDRAAELEQHGQHTVIERWFDAPAGARVDVDNLVGFDGVKNCDVVIALADNPHYPYQGTLFELGMAVALSKRVIVLLPTGGDKGSVGTCIFLRSNRVSRVYGWGGVDMVLDLMMEADAAAVAAAPAQ